MQAADKVIRAITAVFEALTQILLLVMVGVVTWLVISRQILHHASSWAEEISLVMVIWFGLIGATFGVKERYHLRMELFFAPLPRSARVAISIFTDALVALFGLLLLIGGTQHVIQTAPQELPATLITAALRYLPVPITGALIVIYSLRSLVGGETVKDADIIPVGPSPEAKKTGINKE